MKTYFVKSLLEKLVDLLRFVCHEIARFWRWYKRTYKQARWYAKTGIVMASLVALFLIYLLMVDINFLWLFGKSPSLEAIAHPKQDAASIVYSSDGVVMGRYYRENRIPVTYEEISPMMIKALVATEDERFYEHFGIDFEGVAAAVKDMVAEGDARGASTITQQLVKNMFKTRTEYSTGLMGYIPGVRLCVMKTKEWITAVKLEMFFSKQEILTMYLNTVDFGSNAYGIRTAAQTYFSTTPDKLTTEQCATLVGMLKATTTYNPRLHPEASRQRRNVVLHNLYQKNGITKAEYDSLSALPLVLKYHATKPGDGIAPYFRQALAEELNEWCKENGYDLYGDGLKIYTTLDSKMQKYAEEAVAEKMEQVQRNFNADWGNENPWHDRSEEGQDRFVENLAKKTDAYKRLSARFPNDPDSVMRYLNMPHRVKVFDYELGTKDMYLSTMDSIRYMTRFMHCAFLAMEPATGDIKAWVGDIDFDHWEYDKATAERQPGSTFKMFVYAAAMEAGLGPCDDRVDEYRQYDAFDAGHNPIKWAPRNSTGVYTGAPMSLKHAFSNSVNSVAVAVAEEVGMQRVIDVAKRLGIRSPLQNTPALALGSSDVTLLDMVNSYCTIMNGGRRNVPSFVTRIEDKDGNVVYRHEPENKRAVSRETAFLMQQMLLAGMTEPGGTSMALWGYDIHRYDTNFGGKTGTTTGNSDGWYVGVTKNLVAGCWVGGEYRNVHFRSGRMGQGSHTALPVFGRFMEKVLADPSLSRYRGRIPDKPSFEVDRPYDCHTVLPPDTTSVDSLPSAQFAPGIVDVEEESAAGEIEKAE